MIFFSFIFLTLMWNLQKHIQNSCNSSNFKNNRNVRNFKSFLIIFFRNSRNFSFVYFFSGYREVLKLKLNKTFGCQFTCHKSLKLRNAIAAASLQSSRNHFFYFFIFPILSDQIDNNAYSRLCRLLSTVSYAM